MSLVSDSTARDDAPWRARFETIYEVVRQRITLLQYPPGARLDIDQLAAEFGVSRTPIRTVVQQLERDGLAVTRHGVGTVVTDLNVKVFKDATNFRMLLTDLIPVLDARPIEDAWKSRVIALHEKCLALPPELSVERFCLLDTEVHEAILDIIGNPELRSTYDSLYYRSARMWFYFLPKISWQAAVSALAAHIQMLTWAASEKNVEAVAASTRSAIFEGLFRLREFLPEHD